MCVAQYPRISLTASNALCIHFFQHGLSILAAALESIAHFSQRDGAAGVQLIDDAFDHRIKVSTSQKDIPSQPQQIATFDEHL